MRYFWMVWLPLSVVLVVVNIYLDNPIGAAAAGATAVFSAVMLRVEMRRHD